MKINLTASMIALLFVTAAVAFAAPVPPQYILNEATKECSVFYAGDECVACVAPEGWIPLPPGTRQQCPEEYREARIKPVCYPQKNYFCCSKGHSGAPGNCKDLVINKKERKCAFVDDIEKCSVLPKNWRRAEEVNGYGIVCPSLDYEWLDQYLNCEASVSGKAEDVLITLERTLCFGTCPAYTLTIYGNGMVVYEGKDHVEIKGRQTSVISKEKVKELISEFKKIDYFSLRDSYEQHYVTDFPYAITSIRINGKEKTIRHYGADRTAPPRLHELEKKIDEIAGSGRWIKGRTDSTVPLE